MKVVTLRSTYKVVNQTLYPLEITIVDEAGQPVRSLDKIGMYFARTVPHYVCPELTYVSMSVPGQDYALPIEGIATNRIRVQPDREYRVRFEGKDST